MVSEGKFMTIMVRSMLVDRYDWQLRTYISRSSHEREKANWGWPQLWKLEAHSQ